MKPKNHRDSSKNIYGNHGKGAVKRPCLKCDKPFYGTTEVRICSGCKSSDETYSDASRGLDCIAVFE